MQEPAVRIFKAGGGKTVVMDQDPTAAAVTLADDFIQCSTLDAEAAKQAILSYHQEKNILHGIFTVGTDASYTVALAAQALGLPGIDPQAALDASDKYRMRTVLQKADVNVPEFQLVNDVAAAGKIFKSLGADVVIKPPRNMGARGISRVKNIEEISEAFLLAQKYSKDGQVLIERYISGPELSIDALIYQGEIYISGVADRIIEYPPYFVETGHIMPSSLPVDFQDRGIAEFIKAIRALKIDLGAAKGDIKTGPDQAWVGEVAARLSGGFMSSWTYPLSSGVDLIGNALAIAVGMEPYDLRRKFEKVSVERAIIAPPGELNSIHGLDEAHAVPGIEMIHFKSKIGQTIQEPKNNLDKSGNLISAAYERRNALQCVHEARHRIVFNTSSDQSLSFWEQAPWNPEGRSHNYPLFLIREKLEPEGEFYQNLSMMIKACQYLGLWSLVYFAKPEPGIERLLLENYDGFIPVIPLDTDSRKTLQTLAGLYKTGCWMAGLDLRFNQELELTSLVNLVPRDMRLWFWCNTSQLEKLFPVWDRLDAVIINFEDWELNHDRLFAMDRVLIFGNERSKTGQNQIYPLEIFSSNISGYLEYLQDI